MPDIDVDFCFDRRDEVIRYVQREVRRGPGRADHHVRDAQGEAGDQGRRPRARLHLRARPTASRSSTPRRSRARTSRSRRRSRWSRGCASCATRVSARSELFDYALQLEGLLRHASKHAAGHRHLRPAARRGRAALRRQGRRVVTQYAYTDDRRDRPHQVRLPRPEDADADRRARASHPRGARRRDRPSTRLPLDDTADLRAARPRRHRRHLPDGIGRACASS